MYRKWLRKWGRTLGAGESFPAFLADAGEWVAADYAGGSVLTRTGQAAAVLGWGRTTEEERGKNKQTNSFRARRELAPQGGGGWWLQNEPLLSPSLFVCVSLSLSLFLSFSPPSLSLTLLMLCSGLFYHTERTVNLTGWFWLTSCSWEDCCYPSMILDVYWLNP